MKKAITILAVLIVLVGAVFATEEDHKIQIKTKVDGYQPVFQLTVGDLTTNGTRQTARPTKEGVSASGEDFSAKTGADAYTVDTFYDLTSTDIAKDDVSATFTAVLAGNVKLASKKTYTIEFKAEQLESKVTHTWEGQTEAAKYTIKADKTASAIAAATDKPNGVTLGTVTAPAFAANSTTLAGSIPATMDTRNIQPGNLATFSVTYKADENAPVDEYYAYIWMVVTD